MNSRSSVNDSNLVNFSAELTTLNQLDSKDGLLSFPFDHIYACHSGADRRPTLQLDKEIEVSTHCVVEEKNLANPLELTKLQEQINAFENQNKRLKDLLIYHLDLIQQQNEVITKRDKLYQSLKQENDALKAKLLRTDRGVNISPRTQALNAAYHASQPSATITSANEPTTSQIVQTCFADLLLPSKCDLKLDDKTDFKETFGIARLTADPELIAKYTKDPDFSLNNPIIPPVTVGKMIDKKRSLIKKEVRKEIKESRAVARQSAKTRQNRKKPATPRVQRNKRKTANQSGSKRAPKAKPEVSATVTSKTKTVDRLSIERFTINRKTKMINTYGKLKKRNTRFTGSLSDRLRLIDTTPTGEDPYQLGEAEMREQSPIPKLMLNKPNLKRKASGRTFDDKKAKINRFMLAYNQAKEDSSKSTAVEESESELDVVKVDTDVSNTDWSIYNQEQYSFPQHEPDNFSSSLPSFDATEFQEIFTSDISLENLDNINPMDFSEPSEKTERTARTNMTTNVVETNNETAKPGTSNRGRKRAYSTTGLGKQTKPRQKKTRAPKAPRRAKKSPAPGVTTNTPYHTVIGEPDLSWYIGLDSDVKLDDIDPMLSNSMNTVEVPLWREKPFTSSYTLEGTENVNVKLFEKRHTKLEAEERRQLRWHMRRIREQRHMERLRLRHKDAWSNMPVSAPSVYTVWPRPQRDLNELEIALNLPVGAFGEDLPDLPHAPFMLPWVRTSKALKRAKRSKTLH